MQRHRGAASTPRKERSVAPLEIDLLWNALAIRPTGWHRLWSLRREIIVPYEQVAEVTHDPAFARNGPVGLRLPGTNVFGSYIAGTYWKFWDQPRVRSFWVRRHAEKCITLRLRDHWYDIICVEVDDPEREVERIQAAIAEQSPPVETIA
jgi:hypothetical protein